MVPTASSRRSPLFPSEDGARALAPRPPGPREGASMIRRPAQARSRLDPRLYQISVLTGLLVYGLTRLHFEVAPSRAAVILAPALLAQLACARFAATRFEWKSALISGLSLCLLLRTGSPILA